MSGSNLWSIRPSTLCSPTPSIAKDIFKLVVCQSNSNIYQFQNDGLIFICGDFNSRCGDLEYFIAGVDYLPERNVVDFTVNAYGDLLIDFFINTNLCILNGRKYTSNDFTSVSTKGRSVVDYCIVPHECIDSFEKFSVIHVTDMINNIPTLNSVANSGVPDHSLLRWNIICNSVEERVDSCSENTSNTFDKFDFDKISRNFMCDHETVSKLNALIDNLEQGMQRQCDIDTLCIVIFHIHILR